MNITNNTIIMLGIFLVACLMMVSRGAYAGIAGYVSS